MIENFYNRLHLYHVTQKQSTLKIALIAGSARNEGDTLVLGKKMAAFLNSEIFDLNQYDISHYDYEHLNRDDDFLPLIRNIIETYDTIVFLTPVYWYAMSGIMKIFFDRISDLLTIEKDLGRKLRGKNMAVLTLSVGNHLGEYFWMPFEETANYLGMKFLGGKHLIADEFKEEEWQSFLVSIQKEPETTP